MRLKVSHLVIRLSVALLTFTVATIATALFYEGSSLQAVIEPKHIPVRTFVRTTFCPQEYAFVDEEEIYTDDEALTYNEYEVVKLFRKELFRKEKLPSNREIEIAYAVLRKNGKQVAKFDFLDPAFQTEVRFGFFPVLGQDNKQLVVELTTYRGWQYWVIDLYPDFRIIYDSSDYNAGGSLGILDVDKDGRHELVHTLHTFWYFDKLSNTNSPFIDIVFKYEPKLKRYIPANPKFHEFALNGIEQHIREAREVNVRTQPHNSVGDDLGSVLKVFLRYLYAGKELEAWSFYDEVYNSPDKWEVKAKIKKRLSEDAAYRAVRKRTAL
jgi:hypothetical protein